MASFKKNVVFFALAFIVGFAISHFRRNTFKESGPPQKVEVQGSAEVEAMDPVLVDAMKAVVLEEEKKRSLVNEEIPRKNRRRSKADYQEGLDRAIQIHERRAIMEDFADFDLNTLSDAALRSDLLFLKEEVEYIGGRYLSDYDTREFNEYLVILLRASHKFQSEINRREGVEASGLQTIKEADLHPELRKKVNSYIHLGKAS